MLNYLAQFFIGIFLVITSAFHANISSQEVATRPPIATSVPTPTAIPSPTASPTPIIGIKQNIPKVPLIDCVGPDGKHMQVTQTVCDNFNKAWGYVPTATPQPQTNDNTNSPSRSNPQSSNTVFVPVVVKINTPAPITVDCSSISNMIAAIKNEGQVALNSAIAAENSLLGERGIVPGGPGSYYYTQMQAAELPVENQTNLQIAQFCFNNTQTALSGCSCP